MGNEKDEGIFEERVYWFKGKEINICFEEL